jgi:hypothetical protein
LKDETTKGLIAIGGMALFVGSLFGIGLYLGARLCALILGGGN